MKRTRLITLRSATKQTLLQDGLISQHLRFSYWNTKKRFGIAPIFAVHILLDTYFIDRSKRDIFPAKQMSYRGPLNLSPYIAKKENAETVPPSDRENGTIYTCTATDREQKNGLVQIAGQIVLELFSQHPVLVTTTSNSLLLIEPKQVFALHRLIASTNGVMDVLPQRPFSIYVSNLSRRAVRLPKHMLIAQTTEIPRVIHAICSKPREVLDWEPSKSMNKIIKYMKKTLRADSLPKP